MFGSTIRIMSAIPRPAQRVKSRRLSGVRRSPRPSAIRKNAIDGLLSRPTPALIPKNVHHAAGEPPRAILITANRHADQNIASKEFIERKPSTPMYCGVTISPIIPSACAGRRPPRDQQRTPPRKTVIAPAKAESTRIPKTESPKSISPSRACSATTGPWSTYPHAR